jgi:hypothetical protein
MQRVGRSLVSRSVELHGARRVPLFVVDVKQSSLRSIDTNPPALPSSGSLELLSSSLSVGPTMPVSVLIVEFSLVGYDDATPETITKVLSSLCLSLSLFLR